MLKITLVQAFFSAILSNSLKFAKIKGRGTFEVAEIDSIRKIELGQFLVALGSTFAQTMGLTPERLVVWARLLVEFYLRIGHFSVNFKSPKIGEYTLLQ